MRSWIETRWRGDAYFDGRRQAAIALLREALPKRDARWTYAPEQFGPFEMLFRLSNPPLAISVDTGAWRSRGARRIESNYLAYAGRSGFLLISLSADFVLNNVDAALDEALVGFD